MNYLSWFKILNRVMNTLVLQWCEYFVGTLMVAEWSLLFITVNEIRALYL